MNKRTIGLLLVVALLTATIVMAANETDPLCSEDHRFTQESIDAFWANPTYETYNFMQQTRAHHYEICNCIVPV